MNKSSIFLFLTKYLLVIAIFSGTQVLYSQEPRRLSKTVSSDNITQPINVKIDGGNEYQLNIVTVDREYRRLGGILDPDNLGLFCVGLQVKNVTANKQYITVTYCPKPSEIEEKNRNEFAAYKRDYNNSDNLNRWKQKTIYHILTTPQWQFPYEGSMTIEKIKLKFNAMGKDPSGKETLIGGEIKVRFVE